VCETRTHADFLAGNLLYGTFEVLDSLIVVVHIIQRTAMVIDDPF